MKSSRNQFVSCTLDPRGEARRGESHLLTNYTCPTLTVPPTPRRACSPLVSAVFSPTCNPSLTLTCTWRKKEKREKSHLSGVKENERRGGQSNEGGGRKSKCVGELGFRESDHSAVLSRSLTHAVPCIT